MVFGPPNPDRPAFLGRLRVQGNAIFEDRDRRGRTSPCNFEQRGEIRQLRRTDDPSSALTGELEDLRQQEGALAGSAACRCIERNLQSHGELRRLEDRGPEIDLEGLQSPKERVVVVLERLVRAEAHLGKSGEHHLDGRLELPN